MVLPRGDDTPRLEAHDTIALAGESYPQNGRSALVRDASELAQLELFASYTSLALRDRQEVRTPILNPAMNAAPTPRITGR